MDPTREPSNSYSPAPRHYQLLPVEIFYSIFANLTLNDLFGCLQTCRSWGHAITHPSNDTIIWKHRVEAAAISSGEYTSITVRSLFQKRNTTWRQELMTFLVWNRAPLKEFVSFRPMIRVPRIEDDASEEEEDDYATLKDWTNINMNVMTLHRRI